MKRYGIFLCLMGSVGVFADSLDNLAAALKDLADTSKVQGNISKDACLFGPWLMEHHKDLVVAHDEAYGVNKIKIYQIGVLKQGDAECSIHSFRNSLYLLDIVNSPRKDFKTIYDNMVNREGFKQFANITGCTLGEYADYAVKIRENLGTAKIECESLCVPDNFKKYINDIVSFAYYRNINEKDLQLVASAVLQKQLREFIEQHVPKLNFNLKPGESDDISSLNLNDVEKGLKLYIEKLHTSKEYAFAIDLGVAIGGEEHGLTLIVHKCDTVIEYIFADSAGNLFNDMVSKTGKTYAAALDKVIKFVNDPGYLDMCIVRYNVFIDEQHKQEQAQDIEDVGEDIDTVGFEED